MKFSNKSLRFSNAKDECHIEPSNCASIWMTSTWMSSKKKCCLPILWSMKKAGDSYGQAKRQDNLYRLQPDPEEYREVVRAYQQVCSEVITRFDGHIAQYLGDGLLVYFGYPQAHEDDVHRAVRTGLDMLAALEAPKIPLQQEKSIQLAVRIGIHTGLVVVG